MNKVKFFTLISIICLLIMIPISFAEDSQAAVAEDNLTLAGDGSDVLASDWYFDSNAENDGNGSVADPYKLLKSTRIVSNSNLYLANGEYTLDRSVSNINNVTIIGDNPSQTIIRYSGTGFTVSSSLTLKNLTLINLRINNNGNLTASNVIFKDSQYSSSGGVIESYGNHFINLDNCTFSNNSAKYGGAIYIKEGTLTITNSLFRDNHANLYGGAIVGYTSSNIYINDSRFLDSYSISDAGGAIYLFNSSNLIAYNIEINNCSSTFGGAITSLKSSLNLNNFIGRNNKAKYDGGAIYAMYRIVNMHNSLLENNSAENAGAIYVYNIPDFLIDDTQFIENQANNRANAFYSVYLQDPYYDSILHPALNNTFSSNDPSENDVLEVDLPELFIGSNNFTLYKSNFSDDYSIPSSYDLRQLNQTSSVKNQGSDGNCWAFASLGALESSILKAGGIEFDFSEQNMKNLISLYSSYGWNMETNEGGYSRMAFGYLTSWLGPINDSDDEYKLDTALSSVLNSLLHVQNILFLKRDNYTDNDEIKLALMEYGGVAASMYYSSSYAKGKNYYYNGNLGANHLVVIVGWDDNYSKSNFKTTPQGDGAWIIKNSWGTRTGENGYFYVSYYDSKLAKVSDYEPFVFVLNDTIKYDKNYQYDIPGITDYFLNQSNVVWYKNKFTANDNEYLAAVSTYFNKNTAWDLSVYVNNKLKLTQSGSATPSYKTIDLNQLIKLNEGDVFEIVFKITVDNEACVPISEWVSLNTEFYSEKVSYISYDGKNWRDLYNLTWAYSSHTYASQVACIKAFTVLNPIGTSVELEVISPYNPAQLTAIVKDQYGNLIKSGKVSFTIESQTYDVAVVNGIANLDYLFDTIGSKTIVAKYVPATKGYISSTASTSFIVLDKIDTTLTASPITTFYGSGVEFVATLKDANGNPISGANVNFAIGRDTTVVNTTLVTDANGQIRYAASYLNPKVYYANVSFAGNNMYNPCVKEHVKFYLKRIETSLTAPDVTAIYDNGGVLVATLKDSDGQAIKNAKVYITIDGVKSTLKTDSAGQIKFSTNGLAMGNHVAEILYKATTYYYASNTTA
ncbi:MAG: Ig-like domain-containing protein, partial [Methanobrevibacter sp.]|nr:Ig-like domain-containing protein [Methanobrevibacter sp.]